MSTNYNNTIILAGNTGTGKSFVANEIFSLCGSPTRFTSSASTYSVTQTLQEGFVTYQGKTYTILDTPGFFDTSETGTSNDGQNVCKLVKALESCAEIVSIIFIFTDRFSMPHKIWFDRMLNLVGAANRGNLVLLHNKLGPLDFEVQAQNKVDIKNMLGSQQDYVWYSHTPGKDMTEKFLKTVINLSPFQLSNLKIPEICYEKIEEGKPYEVEISNIKTDEGQLVTETKDTSHYEEEMVPDLSANNLITLGLKLIGGAKKAKKTWVPGTQKEEKYIHKEVNKRIVVTYVDVYKVRFDNTKDKVERKEIDRREEISK